ncbi:MAG: prepilin-type N-terminal cleavage/methylation domain-containing protein [Sulfurimonadaceae bacterium]
MRRNGFTLIEMMIAITLFSVVMIFLYQSMATLDKSNQFYSDKLQSISTEQSLFKTLYLDLSLSESNSGEINNINKNEDMVFLQTSHVVHTHVMPYVVYFVKENHLYRVESASKLSYPFESNINALIDDFGEVKKFRLYKNSTHFLLHLNINGKEENLLKIRHLNAQ